MKNNHTKFAFYLAMTAVLVFGLTISTQSLLAGWVAPTNSPPAGNPGLPIWNVSGNPAAVEIDQPTLISNNFAVGNKPELFVDTTHADIPWVGIGTPNPQAELHIESCSSDQTYGCDNNRPYTALRLENNSSENSVWELRAMDWTGAPYNMNNDFAIWGGSGSQLDYRMVIKADGKVGINKTDPLDAVFQINNISSDPPYLMMMENSSDFMVFDVNNSPDYSEIRWGDDYSDRLRFMFDYYSGAWADKEVMTLNGRYGRVGIMENSPDARLHIKSENDRAIRIEEDGGSSEYYDIGVDNYGNMEFRDDSGNLAMTIEDGTRDVGIGVENPNYDLQVNGSAAKTGGGSWANASDARLKDVGNTFDRGLEAVMALRPVYFNYKKDNSLGISSDEEYVGLVAQEVEKVIPEAVGEYQDGYKSLTNDPIIWAMLNAIKELKTENDGLKQSLCETEIDLDFCDK